MSVLNRNAFVVVAADIDVITAVCVGGQLMQILVPRDQFDKACLLAPMALRCAVEARVGLDLVETGAEADV